MWQIIALIVVMISAFSILAEKKMVARMNILVFEWMANISGAVLFFFLFVRQVILPATTKGWFFLLLGGIVWTITLLARAFAVRKTEVSFYSVFSQIGILFVSFLSYFVLSETFPVNKVIGILLIFAGSLVVTVEKKMRISLSMRKTLLIVVFASFFLALASIIDKTAISYLNIEFYGAMMFFLPGFFMTPFVFRKRRDVKETKKVNLFFSAVLGFSWVFLYYLTLILYSMTEVSNVVPFLKLSIVFSVIGGYFLFKEKDIKRKLLGAFFVIAGAMLLK